MNRYRVIVIFVLGCFVCGYNTLDILNAQELPRKENFWLESSNPAGIRQDTSVTKEAEAELFANISSGGFHKTYEASKPWTAGARAYGLVHLKGFSMQGSFSFEQMQGDDMCGSMLLRPDFYPLDVMEFTPGRKIRQSYAFDGAISVDLSSEWRAGAGIDFCSSNYSKRKDLRYSNYILDITVAPAVVWHRNDLSVGFNLLLRKTSETPVAKQIGSKENYYAFLDKGLMYGKYELWEGSGVHLSDPGVNGFPINDLTYGAAVQIQKNGFYAAAEYRYRKGTAGEKQQQWFYFPQNSIGLDLAQTWMPGDVLHCVKLGLEASELKNYENVLEKYSEGGITYYETLSSNKILSSVDVSADLSYSLKDSLNEFEASLNVSNRNAVSSQMYPFAFSQDLFRFNIGLFYLRHISRFDLSAILSYRDGICSESQTMVTENSGVQTTPFRLDEWYNLDMDYKTASALTAGLGLRYNFAKNLFLSLDCNYTKAFSLKYLEGSYRVTSELKFGYKF